MRPVDSDKIRTWKNAFLNGSGLLAVENIIKGHVPTPCNAPTIQNNLYSLNLLRLALDIVQYFINIPLACAPAKIPLYRVTLIRLICRMDFMLLITCLRFL